MLRRLFAPLEEQQALYAAIKQEALKEFIAERDRQREAAEIRNFLKAAKTPSSPLSDGASIASIDSSAINEILADSHFDSMQHLIRTVYQDTPLHTLAKGGDRNFTAFKTRLTEFSKTSKFDLKTLFGKDKKTVMHVAIESLISESVQSAIEIVQFLMVQDPKLVYVKDGENNTPVHLAARLGDLGFDIIRILYSDPKNNSKDLTNTKNDQGENALYLAITSPNYKSKKTENGFKTTEFLLGKQPDLTAITKKGYTLLHGAVMTSKEKILESLLLDTNITPDIVGILNNSDHLINTAVHLAAQNGNLKFVSKLITAGADITITNKRGLNSLNTCIIQWSQHLSNTARSKNFEDTAILLSDKNPALLQTKGPHDFVSLHHLIDSAAVFLAAVASKPEDAKNVLPIFDFIANKIKDLEAIDEKGNNAFQRAVALSIPPTIPKGSNFAGMTLFVPLLDTLLPKDNITRFVNYACPESDKNTALHYAVLLNTSYAKAMVSYLLEKGAKPNVANSDRYHPLDLVNYLLSINTDQSKLDELIAIKDLLESKGATPNITITTQNFHLPEFICSDECKTNWHFELYEDRANTPKKNKFPSSIADSTVTATTTTYDVVSVPESDLSDYVSAGLASHNSRAPSEISEIPEGDIYYQDNEDDNDLVQYSVELHADQEETTPTDTANRHLPDSEYSGYRPKF